MNLQTIKSIQGEDEYVLLPIKIYHSWQQQIDAIANDEIANDEIIDFELSDYVSNPIALGRIKAEITQQELAKQMDVSQAYISKIEAQPVVSAKILKKFSAVLDV